MCRSNRTAHLLRNDIVKRQEILKLLKESRYLKKSEIYSYFDCNNDSKKKRIDHLLKELVKNEIIKYDEGEDNFSFIKSPDKKESISKKLISFTKPQSVERRKNNSVDAGMDFDSVIERYKIRKDFPPSIIAEAESIDSSIPAAEIKKRLDLRKKLIVTIDGSDAKDLDDAVSIEKMKKGWQLGVHIADVSYYVRKNSKLDREAIKRGNSFYFINKVVPMFPKILSNGICSLNPQEDRLTLSVIMDIDEKGIVQKYKIFDSIIHSSFRLTYDWVQSFINGSEKTSDNSLSDSLLEMNQLFRVLNNKRLREGGIDFDFKEQKCALDEKDEPVKLWLKERQDSERIIEEFMLIANQIVAKFLSEKGVSLYRIHAEPEVQKLQDFVRLALKFGHKVNGVPVPDTKELQRVLEEVKDKPHKELVNQILLRSMQQAKYDTENIGHFGLGFDYYTHFTSPIRRYAESCCPPFNQRYYIR